MAKQILDLYMLYKLVTEKGGLVEIINKKIWREITKGLNLPTSITSAAFTLRTQYMKYLYAYECEKKALSSPAELQAAIDGNRREGRRPSYSSSLFGYSPAAATAAATAGAPALLSPPKIRFPILGLGSSSGTNTSSPRISPAATLRKGSIVDCSSSSSFAGDGAPVTTVPVPNRLAVPVTLASQQAGPRTATLEQLRERLESGEPAEKKASRLSEEEQRLVQQAFQRNFFSMARQLPMKIRINGRGEPGSGQVFPFLLSAKPQPIHASWDWWGRGGDLEEAPPGSAFQAPRRQALSSQFTRLRLFSRGPHVASGSTLFSSKREKQLFMEEEPEAFRELLHFPTSLYPSTSLDVGKSRAPSAGLRGRHPSFLRLIEGPGCPGMDSGTAIFDQGWPGSIREDSRSAVQGLTRPNVPLSPAEDRAEASAAALNLTTSSIGSINMSVDIDGTTYTGVLFAQKPVVHLLAGSAPQSLGSSASSSSSSHCSPSPTSSRGTPSAEPSTSWSL
ncbi:AT-rich interactive domain-containing protein 3B [Saguinus oedipus]|uniref:AT-rich interactive domain-containing protein 3 n=1 Tax=Saguinus oedipus TaxID=9490 RepID=A0ABQ9V2F2_SAGOE|nr:AT-rich interactive domain-containing protein 3B [Saguinus oedipus]